MFGATGGIGSALCRNLTDTGHRVVAAARNGDALASLGTEVVAHELEEMSFDAIETCLRSATELADGSLAGVANCVGSLLLKPAHITTEEEWRSTIDANLTSAFGVVRAAGKVMRKGGSVVLCSSAAAQTGLANHDAIGAAKAGVEGLVRSAAASYAPRGLRINAVAPGLVETPMTVGLTSSEAVLDASRTLHALRRIGQPEEIARAIAWLLDPLNSWVTGQVWGVDGGLAHVRPAPRR